MRPTSIVISPISDADYIAASQTPTGTNAAVALNSSFTNSDGHIEFTDFHKVTITSGANISGRTFTVVGLDERGLAQSEAITGPNATTVEGTKYWSKITAITISDTAAGAITIGVNGECVSPWIPHNWRCSDFQLSQEIIQTGTMTWGVQHTLDRIQDVDATITAQNNDTLIGETVSGGGNYDTPVTASRIQITAFTSGSLEYKTIVACGDGFSTTVDIEAGNNITVEGGGGQDFTITGGAGGSGETNTASNNGDDSLGGGPWKEKSGPDLVFNRIVAGSNITVDGGNASGGDITISGAASGSGSAITLDLGDDSGNDSTDLQEIATSGDTNNIFTEPAADKLLINCGNNWPSADVADALSTGALDNLNEINASLLSGSDATLLTGTAGTNGNLAQWNADGDAVDSTIPANTVLVDSDIGTSVQAHDPDTLKADLTDQLTVGYDATVYNAGTQTTGTFTPDKANGNKQRKVNGGAHTLAPPTTYTNIEILYSNNASAGAITTSGFTVVKGDSLTTTNGHEFLMQISTTTDGSSTFSVLNVIALQ